MTARRLPCRPYRNFKDFCAKHSLYANVPYPCVNCLGRGFNRDSNECDPVEGLKFAKLLCRKCAGSGRLLKAQCKTVYNEHINLWKKERDRMRRVQSLAVSARKKLTKTEFEAIVAWYG